MKPYQTEVGILITPPVEVEIKEIIDTYLVALEGMIEQLVQPNERMPIEFYQLDDYFYGERSIVLNGVFTQWNIGNPSYDAIVLLLHWIENIGGSYHYLTMGDNYIDVEEEEFGEPEGYIQLHRVMHW
jgi:hypothetical protein